MLMMDNEQVDKLLPLLDTWAEPSNQAKFVEMPDDSMGAEFNKGDHLLLDPQVQPHAGDIVLVRTQRGEHFVRKYVPRTGVAFDAEPLNRNYARLSSDADKLRVVAVMIEHRRYRRRQP